jgi:hypothetical protein
MTKTKLDRFKVMNTLEAQELKGKEVILTVRGVIGDTKALIVTLNLSKSGPVNFTALDQIAIPLYAVESHEEVKP